MELYTLNLSKPLAWRPVAPAVWNALISSAGSAGFPEGSEAAAWWRAEDILTEGEDGPRLALPLPPPYLAGMSLPATAAETKGESTSLPAGRYLFAQARLECPDSVSEALEWFARESWWTKAKAEGPLVVRLVHEDGKTALQVIRALVPGS